VRVLVVTNLVPDDSAPQRGRWVFDQIDQVRKRGIEVDVFAFPPGRREYLPATRRLRSLLRRQRFDLVHAHYGLAGWCARLAGARPLLVTFHGTDVRHPVVGALSRRLAWRIDLTAAVSRSLFAPRGRRYAVFPPSGGDKVRSEAGLPPVPGSAVLPCGPDLSRFVPIPRDEARRALGLDPEGSYLFFPANPARPEKRHDRAAELAASCGAELLSGGSIEPERMPLWLNAANAVLVTSDYEGFGMAAVEALACGVPVLSTPVGIAPYALAGVAGCLCDRFELGSWSDIARRHIREADPRVDGEARAALLSAPRMAERVIEAYRDIAAMPVID
jgi:glycosyltransferase involved in cell wall biosynthesis